MPPEEVGFYSLGTEDLWAWERQIISGLGNVTNRSREAGLGQGSIQRQVQVRAA